MKNKETLEEFIQRQLSLGKYQDQESAIKYSILAGANWQQEQNKNLYSEEDVKKAFFAGLRKAHSFKKNSQCWEEWFNQFKKK